MAEQLITIIGREGKLKEVAKCRLMSGDKKHQQTLVM
jgi:hypothetical protein